ncbi:YfhO family protein [Candidatus Curtissbacteria bacterium]|nr:YfhO family protein [Candidatus Curtissbacteria bacterium]
MPKIFLKLWPFLFLIVIIFIFFARLFIPHQTIFITPDYGRSDAWHLSIAHKYYLAQELKKNRLPIWNPHIGTGFPTLAEGQTGIFFLPNLILFRFLPFVTAYNLSIITAFLIAAFGTYFFCRSLTLTKLASLYGASVFALGGFFMVHVQHLHLIQTASILPWLFWATNEFLKSRKILFLIYLSLLLSQQIFAGFPQITIYGLFALSIYIVFQTIAKKKKAIKSLSLLILSALFGFVIASIQIAPTFELLKIANRSDNPRSILTQFPYKTKNLLQFFDPYVLGSPKDGTYPHWSPNNWGIYWESIAYVGIIPLSLTITLILLLPFTKMKYKKEIVIFTILLVTSILLSLGASAPLHPLFSIPPFSIFRVPSRFLLITQLSLCILAAIYIDKIAKKHFLYASILIVSTVNLFVIFKNYNPIGSAKDWLTPPQTAQYLESQNPARIYSFGQLQKWNDYFLSNGWQDTGYYYFARNSLDQNANLIFNLSQVLSYESLPTQRSVASISSISSAFKKEGSAYSTSANLVKFLATANVSHVITTENIESPDFQKVFATEVNNNTSFKIYKLVKNPSRLFVTDQIKTANTIPQITKAMQNPDFNPTTQTIMEIDSNLPELKLQNWEAKIVEETPTRIKIGAKIDGNGALVLSDSFYPGWQATVNGRKTTIYPANINSRAIFLENGENQIIFEYKPRSFYYSLPISLISLTFIVFCIFKFLKTRIT